MIGKIRCDDNKRAFAQEPCQRLCSSVHRLWVWFGRAHRHSVSAPGAPHHKLDHQLIVITMTEIILCSYSGITLWMDIILVSNVTARRRIPLLPMFCHWLGQRPVWGWGTISGEVQSSSLHVLPQNHKLLGRLHFKVLLCMHVVPQNTFTNWHWQVVLKEIDLPVVEHGQCEQALRSTRQEEK